VARKAPLVASDTSSSGGSDSEEEEEKTESVTMEIVSKEMVTTETIVTTAGLETIRLNMNVKNERAGFNRYIQCIWKEFRPLHLFRILLRDGPSLIYTQYTIMTTQKQVLDIFANRYLF
jgi:hypothetical protein